MRLVILQVQLDLNEVDSVNCELFKFLAARQLFHDLAELLLFHVAVRIDAGPFRAINVRWL